MSPRCYLLSIVSAACVRAALLIENEIDVQFQYGVGAVTAQRGTYRTKQRNAIASYLAQSTERYLSVDEVWTGVSAGSEGAGRSTVYRTLEAMSADGTALKAMSPNGEARYRMAVDGAFAQLVCLDCGRALSLDCTMVADFASHVLDRHGFKIDATRTVLYGLCKECRDIHLANASLEEA